MVFNATDGMIIMGQADELAQSLSDVAEHNPKIKKVLMGVGQASVYIPFLITHASVTLALLANHRVVKPPSFMAQAPTSHPPQYPQDVPTGDTPPSDEETPLSDQIAMMLQQTFVSEINPNGTRRSVEI
jgi:hypothetical protein